MIILTYGRVCEIVIIIIIIIIFWHKNLTWARAASFFEVCTSHTVTQTPQSVELLWTRDRPVAETTHNTHNRQTSMPPGRIFFLFCVVCLYFFVLIVLTLCLLSLLYDTQHKHPCPRRDSNPQSQQAIGRRPSP